MAEAFPRTVPKDRYTGVQALFNGDLHNYEPDYAPREDWVVLSAADIVYVHSETAIHTFTNVRSKEAMAWWDSKPWPEECYAGFTISGLPDLETITKAINERETITYKLLAEDKAADFDDPQQHTHSFPREARIVELAKYPDGIGLILQQVIGTYKDEHLFGIRYYDHRKYNGAPADYTGGI